MDSNGNDELVAVLQERGIAENIIEDMIKEKLDAFTICLMNEEQLKRFLPSEGDRLFVKSYCTKVTSPGPPQSKKEKLVEKLRKKLGMKRTKQVGNDEDEQSTSKHVGNKHGRTKQDCNDEDEQSTSKLVGNKHAMKQERRVQLGWLHRSSETEEYKQVRIQNGGGTRVTRIDKDATKETVFQEGVNLFFPNGKSIKGPVSKFDMKLLDVSKQEVAPETTVSQLHEQFKVPLLRCYIATTAKTKKELLTVSSDSDSDGFVDPFSTIDVGSEVTVVSSGIDDTIQMPVGSEVTVVSSGIDDTILMPVGETSGMSSPSLIQEHHYQLIDTGTPTINFNMNTNAGCNVTPVEPEFQQILIRRSNVVEDFISNFKDENLMDKILEVRMVQTNGTIEEGEGHGVFRDALTEFWGEFCRYAGGHEYKVPIIRHDFGTEKWAIIGRILSKGWQDTGYFPIMLAPAFMEQCLYGGNDEDILECFMMYISDFEREALQNARNAFPDDIDEIVDILDGYDSKAIPTADNISRLLREIAHKELIQKPMFVIDCWRPVLSSMVKTLDREKFKSLYSELVPTVKRVTEMLRTSDEVAGAEKIVMGYLKKYIRSLCPTNLKLLLRFCTGSDLLTCPRIYVTFNDIEGFTRSPIGHTCTTTLELPSTYDNFVDFKNEFDGILTSNVWVMGLK